jgi:TRAP-type C4-dicarboxylate transport system substrate-binding protein
MMFHAASVRTAAAVASFTIAALVGVGGTARAQTFEFAVWYSDRDFYAEHVRRWVAEIERRTEGRVKINLHFSGALVPAKETVNAVRNGAVGGGTTSISFVAGLVRPVSYMEPLLWIPADPKVTVPTMQQLLEPSRKLMEQRGLKLMFTFPSAGLVTNCISGHVKKTTDFKGKKVRAAGRWQGIQLRAVGAAPVAIDPGEVYIALQNKTVDCMMFLANLTLSAKVYEVAPYITYLRDGANASMYYLNLDQWNKVSPADQKIMLEVSNEGRGRRRPQTRADGAGCRRCAGEGWRQDLSRHRRGDFRNEEGHVGGLAGGREGRRPRGQAVRRGHPAIAEIGRDRPPHGRRAAIAQAQLG